MRSSSDGLASSCKDCSKTKTQEARKHFVPFPTVEMKVQVAPLRGHKSQYCWMQHDHTLASHLLGPCCARLACSSDAVSSALQNFGCCSACHPGRLPQAMLV